MTRMDTNLARRCARAGLPDEDNRRLYENDNDDENQQRSCD